MAKKKTQEEVIQEFRAVHGNKYDYSLVKYVNSRTKVTIICPSHGEFIQRVDTHGSGKGCQLCGKKREVAKRKGISEDEVVVCLDEFVSRASRVHNGYYDYSKAEYKGSSHKLTITCPKHGDFKQSASGHLRGGGCRKCGFDKIQKSKSKGIELFLSEAKNKHGDKFDYSSVLYKNNRSKITIICPVHGEFEQTPSEHLKGHGCYHCGVVEGSIKNKKKQDEFLSKAKLVHGDKYDFSDSVYLGSNKKVSVTCREHGVFTTTPDSIYSGSGCPLCASESRGEKTRVGRDRFISRSREAHGDKYLYRKVGDLLITEKVEIICQEHGSFWQIADAHMRGSGCPSCANYGFNTSMPGYLYVLGSDCGGMMKIGISNGYQKRIAHLAKVTPFEFAKLEVYYFADGKDANDLETELLRAGTRVEFADKFDGHSEWLAFDGQLVELARKRHSELCK